MPFKMNIVSRQSQMRQRLNEKNEVLILRTVNSQRLVLLSQNRMTCHFTFILGRMSTVRICYNYLLQSDTKHVTLRQIQPEVAATESSSNRKCFYSIYYTAVL